MGLFYGGGMVFEGVTEHLSRCYFNSADVFHFARMLRRVTRVRIHPPDGQG